MMVLQKNKWEFNKNKNETFKSIDDPVFYKTTNNFNNKNNSIDIDSYNKKNYPNFNKTCDNFHRNKFNSKELKIKTDDDFHFNVTNRTFKKFFDYNKICSTINYIKPENDLRFIDPRSKYNRTMKVTFNFKPKPKSNKMKIQKIKVS